MASRKVTVQIFAAVQRDLAGLLLAIDIKFEEERLAAIRREMHFADEAYR